MKLFKRLVLLLVSLVIVLLVVGFLLPSTSHVERSVVIAVPPAKVFAEVNDLRNWPAWSVWMLRDPEMAIEYSGATVGAGSTSTWKSESQGNGSQTIAESVPNERINTTLDFGDMGSAVSTWTFSADGTDSTLVTWGFDTDPTNNPVLRYFGLMLDSLVGPDYKEGLGNLKKVCESVPSSPEVPSAP